ncbi:hypothetical protein [Brevibacillus porteri]|uniref:Peptidase n=1 Tax=Brevibacillus porteri TaxID=2126350 RepID=A0ABX5FS45_9BACL|nr:hypothetical protein [Brevibacillus porteri]MED1800607.1 hypothetical protein [Brevibacillus porteri]MED2134765.1 hypothetical protein [Brevibacillus porteri]MED2745578.1 hypothetical protein [Brevibacillus porteri]MED2815581.1 hypothetical protein [Brevibacillus porteri]MED2896358.1 hypothetical protein [Brevibacillus porteri]
MKKILLALTLVFALSSSAFAANTETEPNDTIATADTLEVNSSISGKADNNDVDIFVFVANQTGKMRTNLTNKNQSVAPYVVLASDKTTSLAESSGEAEFEVVAGETYYIKLISFGKSDYTLSLNNL